MYAWLWRHLPGGTAARALQALVLLGLALVLLVLYAFPAIEARLPQGEVTVDAGAGAVVRHP